MSAVLAANWSVADLLPAAAYPHPMGVIELRETHISWILLTGYFAYKVKKPIKLDFIDASTLEQRRHYCEEEVRLNRRLAPSLYLDVVTVTRDGNRLAMGGNGTVVDYAVKMHQFSPCDELPVLLARNEVSVEEIAALGESLAAFHTAAPVAPKGRAAERIDEMRDAVLGNLAELGAHLTATGSSQTLSRLMDWTCDSARALAPIVEEREHYGFARECHGDLHAANIVKVEGRLTPFDCIEFDPKLRWIDVMSDLAFLVMDLKSRRRSDLAFALLSRYLEVTGDYAGVSVLPFYATYRALVRAKVDVLSAEHQPAQAPKFRHRLQQRILAASSWTTLPAPLLVLMHGPSGSGKSWLAERLVPQLEGVRIRSDLERKRQAGIAPSQSASAAVRQRMYTPEFGHRTYSHLADCAEVCLRAGINTIVDAAFLDQMDREVFRSLAAHLGIPCVIVSCQADPIRLATRIVDRAREHADASDATLSVLDAQLREMRPLAPNEHPCELRVDTSEPDVVQRTAAAIAARRAG